MRRVSLGGGSEIEYFPELITSENGRLWLRQLDQEIPWTRPSLLIYGRHVSQPRDTCYVADKGLPAYKYSSYQPVVHKWDDFPILKLILDLVHAEVPEVKFNSVLLNRYNDGVDYAAWHSDDEKVYGPTPTIASVTLGAEREFLVRRKRPNKSMEGNGSKKIQSKMASPEKLAVEAVLASEGEVKETNAFKALLGKRPRSNYSHDNKDNICFGENSMAAGESAAVELTKDVHTFLLKHGSLLVMRGYTQRDWQHSVPRRKKVSGMRINLTFRHIFCSS